MNNSLYVADQKRAILVKDSCPKKGRTANTAYNLDILCIGLQESIFTRFGGKISPGLLSLQIATIVGQMMWQIYLLQAQHCQLFSFPADKYLKMGRN